MRVKGCIVVIGILICLVGAVTLVRCVGDLGESGRKSLADAKIEQDRAAVLNRAGFFEEQKLFEKGLAEYRQFVQMGGRFKNSKQVLSAFVCAIEQGDYTFGSNLMNYAPRWTGRDEAGPYYILFTAICLIAEGHVEKAKTVTSGAFKWMNPKDWTYSLVLFLNGDISEEQLLTIAGRDTGKITEAKFFIGTCAWASGRISDAQRNLSWAISEGPDDYMARLMAPGILRRVSVARRKTVTVREEIKSLGLDTIVSNSGVYSGQYNLSGNWESISIRFQNYSSKTKNFAGVVTFAKGDLKFPISGKVKEDALEILVQDPRKTLIQLNINQSGDRLEGVFSNNSIPEKSAIWFAIKQ